MENEWFLHKMGTTYAIAHSTGHKFSHGEKPRNTSGTRVTIIDNTFFAS